MQKILCVHVGRRCPPSSPFPSLIPSWKGLLCCSQETQGGRKHTSSPRTTPGTTRQDPLGCEKAPVCRSLLLREARVCVRVCVLWEEGQSINFFLCLSHYAGKIMACCCGPPWKHLPRGLETPSPALFSLCRVWLRSLCKHTHARTHPTSASHIHTPLSLG